MQRRKFEAFAAIDDGRSGSLDGFATYQELILQTSILCMIVFSPLTEGSNVRSPRQQVPSNTMAENS